MGHDHGVESEVALDQGAGLRPRRASADGRGQDQGEAALAGAQLGCGSGDERCAEPGCGGRLTLTQPRGEFVLQLAALLLGQAAEQQIAADRAGERWIHDRQIQLWQFGGDSRLDTLWPFARDSFCPVRCDFR